MSRSLKTWGASESGLAEMIADRVETQKNPTIAFLARGIEGIVVRVTAKAPSEQEARALIEPEEAALRAILGDLVFAVDDETMEHAVLSRLEQRGWTLGVAESLTGGLIGARIASVPGASRVFQGSIASYATDVKRSVLGVTADKVVSRESAEQMAEGAQRVLGADVGIAATGVAGPTTGGTSRSTVVRACAARPPGRSDVDPPYGVAGASGGSHALVAQHPADATRHAPVAERKRRVVLRRTCDAWPERPGPEGRERE